MFARVTTVAFEGIEARAVDVQVQVGPGMAAFTIVGLPDKAVAESRERVRGALNAIGLALPPKRITVNLAPADLPKEGSHNISALCQPPSCRCYSHSSPRSRQSPSVVAIQIHPRARTNGLPKVTFHSIRHSHASALIRARRTRLRNCFGRGESWHPNWHPTHRDRARSKGKQAIGDD
jgi:hypothetical protein